MAAATVVNFKRRGANPGNTLLSDTPSVAATGPTGRIYPVPTMAQNLSLEFSVPSTAVATLEASCDDPAFLAADVNNGTWKAVSAALTGVTTGAIVLASIPLGITALRVNVGTLLAANVATVKAATNNSLF